MSKVRTFSSKIIQIYVIGVSALFLFYMYAFHAGTMLTENALMERRINTVAQFHFTRFEAGENGIIAIDPLLTLYDDRAKLPREIRSNIPQNWTGSMQVLLENEDEFQVVARKVSIDEMDKIVYAVENSNAVEWDDTKLILIEVSIGLFGLTLFMLTMLYLINAAKRIASPFLYIAQKLETELPNHFDNIDPPGEKSMELEQITQSLNTYRARLCAQLKREKSFTRYVSHELRTPMMIIKGVISSARKKSYRQPDASLKKVETATQQMQELTQTFLMLARDESPKNEETYVDGEYVNMICKELDNTIKNNQIHFCWQLNTPFRLECQALLLKAVILNLLKNAFSHSINGNVNLFVSESGVDVIDDGTGLDNKPDDYEGFGIGLTLVKDVCAKYGWQFQLIDNKSQGCTASVAFAY